MQGRVNPFAELRILNPATGPLEFALSDGECIVMVRDSTRTGGFRCPVRNLSVASVEVMLRQMVGAGACEIKILCDQRWTDWAQGVLQDWSRRRGSGATGTVTGRAVPLKGFALWGEYKFRLEKVAEPESQKTRVLVVDDSSTIRQLLKKILSADPGIEVVAEAERPSQVEDLIRTRRPDVMTLDIHMPEMNGVDLLERLLPKYRIPTIMISSLSLQDGNFVLTALEKGAVDYIQKPSFDDLRVVGPQIVEKVKHAKSARVRAVGVRTPLASSKLLPPQELNPRALVVIGASTGGTEALKDVLTVLPAQIPPVLIVQHIPPVFSKAFADRLRGLCAFDVREAVDGDEVKPGTVLIAPGGLQMRAVDTGGTLRVRVEDTAPVNRHKPSVDVLFESAAKLKGKDLVAVILTGMGADGARGMKTLHDQGVFTIAQDQETSAVYGMPREAAKLGGVDKVLPLGSVAGELMKRVARKQAA